MAVHRKRTPAEHRRSGARWPRAEMAAAVGHLVCDRLGLCVHRRLRPRTVVGHDHGTMGVLVTARRRPRTPGPGCDGGRGRGGPDREPVPHCRAVQRWTGQVHPCDQSPGCGRHRGHHQVHDPGPGGGHRRGRRRRYPRPAAIQHPPRQALGCRDGPPAHDHRGAAVGSVDRRRPGRHPARRRPRQPGYFTPKTAPPPVPNQLVDPRTPAPGRTPGTGLRPAPVATRLQRPQHRTE